LTLGMGKGTNMVLKTIGQHLRLIFSNPFYYLIIFTNRFQKISKNSKKVLLKKSSTTQGINNPPFYALTLEKPIAALPFAVTLLHPPLRKGRYCRPAELQGLNPNKPRLSSK